MPTILFFFFNREGTKCQAVCDGGGQAGTRSYLLGVSEVPPEGVVNASRGLLGMTGHGFDENLQRALQQHVHAAVVVVVVAACAGQERKS